MLNGKFLWPSRDIDCRSVIMSEVKKLENALRRVRNFGVVVQAGGNCGVFPYYLSERFERVYTFEPEPENFYHLVRNVRAENVVKIQGALGNYHQLLDIEGEARNCGAYQVRPGTLVPTFRIDDLGLTSCDFLCLDIEGSEYEALLGASATLETFHPVVFYEDKGIGGPKDEIGKWLTEEFGYETERLPRDVLAW